MKESGMDKLIELLNQFEDTDNWENGYQVKFRESKIISKKFGFIKWLVQNDKIDLSKLEKIGREETVCMYDGQYRKIVEYPDYESLLMLLSISDNPIEFLCEILK